MILSPLAKAYIAAAKAARDRAALEAWMTEQKPNIQRHLPSDQAEAAIEDARQHWRQLPREAR
ncbi:high-affinity Fe2+/Pb2+ permease [Bosea sp. BE271]|uniref:hypothetical protein n=1 Tax=Bosea TaxID=85413 RepID=UPI00286778CB|nr:MULTISPECIES: hypothetical protein [Bosea]MDR6826452.1 high-affinity Fe2+/Pb2+ permease [Bosea robiniae]MDR6893162.1 high-affinity Fe2+/Pb2+ permease [Bosea sp. BE109]MDR7137139.1 high-affinity Fe2+/Pb2+ permease [Bosea sp. BE168]MDR7173838.1 high-affinity Fe2+/Pb2+ permease [Bosea sp. BE271]